jgi:hypothetical protein
MTDNPKREYIIIIKVHLKFLLKEETINLIHCDYASLNAERTMVKCHILKECLIQLCFDIIAGSFQNLRDGCLLRAALKKAQKSLKPWQE